jgi:hypothetical protein
MSPTRRLKPERMVGDFVTLYCWVLVGFVICSATSWEQTMSKGCCTGLVSRKKKSG